MDTTAKGVVDFLNFAASKGLLNKNTAGSLKAAFKEVVSTTEGEAWEAVEIEAINVDDCTTRFERLKAGAHKPDTLTVYKSRFRQAVQLFREYAANPSGWRYKPERPAALRRKPDQPRAANNGSGKPPAAPDSGNVAPALYDYGFPLRPGLMVSLKLPTDLTKQEATRLATYLSTLTIEPIPLLMGPRHEGVDVSAS